MKIVAADIIKKANEKYLARKAEIHPGEYFPPIPFETSDWVIQTLVDMINENFTYFANSGKIELE